MGSGSVSVSGSGIYSGMISLSSVSERDSGTDTWSEGVSRIFSLPISEGANGSVSLTGSGNDSKIPRVIPEPKILIALAVERELV